MPTWRGRSNRFGFSGHVVFANYLMCSQATGQKSPATTNVDTVADRAVSI